MSGGPAKDGIPALTEPDFIAANQAEFLRDDELVVGITIDGQHKAYPIKVLNFHEIVNFEIHK